MNNAQELQNVSSLFRACGWPVPGTLFVFAAEDINPAHVDFERDVLSPGRIPEEDLLAESCIVLSVQVALDVAQPGFGADRPQAIDRGNIDFDLPVIHHNFFPSRNSADRNISIHALDDQVAVVGHMNSEVYGKVGFAAKGAPGPAGWI